MFQNRADAGKRLAAALEKYRQDNPLIIGIARGGVVVATEVAAELGAALDVIIPRKVGAPGNEELAIGATTGEGQVIINEDLVAGLGVSDDYINTVVDRENAEIKRRRRLYLGSRETPRLKDRVVIVVDDGLATGYTALAAVAAVKKSRPSRTVLAVPVAPAETIERLRRQVDELICLATPEPFFAVGQFYAEFGQVSDEEVIFQLRKFAA